jgi:hypothetical protein
MVVQNSSDHVQKQNSKIRFSKVTDDDLAAEWRSAMKALLRWISESPAEANHDTADVLRTMREIEPKKKSDEPFTPAYNIDQLESTEA